MDELHIAHFIDRRDAGRQLARALTRYRDAHPVVLALPRGGVPVGYEIARALEAPLDVLLVRKLGAPGFPELGIGAVVEGRHPQRVLNDRVMEAVQPSDVYLDEETARQLEEIERRRRHYRGDRPMTPVEGRTVILTDDGVATGGTARVALRALARAGVRHLVLALPVAPRELLESLQESCDDLVCLHSPLHFASVGACYGDFTQVPDDSVIELLQAARAAAPPSMPAAHAAPPELRHRDERWGDPDVAPDIDEEPEPSSPLASLPARGPQPVPALLQPWPLRDSEPPAPPAPHPPH
ncbi:phosphoribosyltransferase [Caldimonas tepidiphila]|uniref:phosphoribosyltransferase n=1 Tax=Caldimonas tepidiphila TaxID=2315841 RepID=UPI000E5AEB85|nr:phosphoribosyltransferase family protein [Caldimonas tepidiphila]